MFRTQSQEIKERGGNQTSGIDFFITQERIIFLDTQVGDVVIFLWFVLAPNHNLPISSLVPLTTRPNWRSLYLFIINAASKSWLHKQYPLVQKCIQDPCPPFRFLPRED